MRPWHSALLVHDSTLQNPWAQVSGEAQSEAREHGAPKSPPLLPYVGEVGHEGTLLDPPELEDVESPGHFDGALEQRLVPVVLVSHDPAPTRLQSSFVTHDT